MTRYHIRWLLTPLLFFNAFFSYAAPGNKQIPSIFPDSLSSFCKSELIKRKETVHIVCNNPPSSYSLSKFIKGDVSPISSNCLNIVGSKPQLGIKKTLDPISEITVLPDSRNDEVTIKYVLHRDEEVTIKIMDLLGNEVSTLMSKQIMQAGSKEVTINFNRSLEKGYYFVRVVAGDQSVSKRIYLL